MPVLVALAFVVCVLAAARSTWSPCGLSMLSTITPLSESARGHRYGATAAWFVAGAIAGGATLGAALAVGAAGVRALDPTTTATALAVVVAAFVAAASDLGLAGLRLPAHRRQVDEVWLTGFRPWVYGLGFGWQIGVGLATYVTTAAVYLMCVLAVLTASPVTALALGVVFGAVRGLAVLLGRRLRDPASLRALHARLEALDVAAALTVVVGVAAVAVVAAAVVSPTACAVALAVTAFVVGVRLAGRRSRVVSRARGQEGASASAARIASAAASAPPSSTSTTRSATSA